MNSSSLCAFGIKVKGHFFSIYFEFNKYVLTWIKPQNRFEDISGHNLKTCHWHQEVFIFYLIFAYKEYVQDWYTHLNQGCLAQDSKLESWGLVDPLFGFHVKT